MRTACQAALLLACFIWAIHAQAQSSHSTGSQENNQGNRNASESSQGQATHVKHGAPAKVVDEPIRFNTKTKDACTMVISVQIDFTKLRVTCKGKGRSYRCDYLGKPNLCRSYNNNPRHYFTQIMWVMRKLENPCQGDLSYKPQMCRSAVDEAKMVFHNSWPKTSTPRPAPAQPAKTGATSKPPTAARPPQKPAKPATKPVSKPDQPRKPTKSTTPKPTAEPGSQANKLAEEYCWSSIQNICAYFIGWFQN
ncbi:fibroblast growth factor-binding protein 2b [Hoplias malabaricus]|uniref:fibroblast growth factor-binding protein 2b n=1 Tax=Hoplias malabaricus TaxID=27720 RepID=UPI003461FCBF